MAVIHVNGMHCSHCVARIEKALNALNLECEVSLDQKTVKVEASETILKKAAETIEDLGFDIDSLEN